MKIINKTKNTIIAENVTVANVPLARIRGLLGRKGLLKGEALVIRPCNSIHTFFMQFPIDVLFLDKNNKVVKAIPNLKPFRLTPIYFNASIVAELYFGTIKSTNTCEGDQLFLE